MRYLIISLLVFVGIWVSGCVYTNIYYKNAKHIYLSAIKAEPDSIKADSLYNEAFKQIDLAFEEWVVNAPLEPYRWVPDPLYPGTHKWSSQHHFIHRVSSLNMNILNSLDNLKDKK